MIMAPSWVSKGAPFQGTLFRKTSRGSPLHYPSLGSLKEKLKRTNLFQQKSRKVITYLTWVKVVLPYCYLILLGFPFFHKTVKTPRPGLGTADSRGPQKGRWVPRWVRRFHGGRRIFWRCPRVNPGNFRELPIFRPTFHGQVGGFEKSADSEAFGGDLWIPLDS